MKTTSIGAIAAVFLVAGCSSSSGVVPMGKGMLSITKQQGSGFPGLGNLKAEVFQAAAAHCALQKRDFEVADYSETKPPYILGNYPRVDLSFRCA